MNKILEFLLRIKNILTLDKKSIRGFIVYIIILITIFLLKIYNKYRFNKKIKELYISNELLLSK